MTQGPPVEDNLLGGGVDLLKATLHNPSLTTGDSNRTEIVMNRHVHSHKCRGTAADEIKLVHVCRRCPITGVYRVDDRVCVVHDGPLPSTISILLVSLEEAKVIRALIGADVEVVHIRRARCPEAIPH